MKHLIDGDSHGIRNRLRKHFLPSVILDVSTSDGQRGPKNEDGPRRQQSEKPLHFLIQ